MNAAFWLDVPIEQRLRLKLELNLILKWLTPFNYRELVALGAAIWLTRATMPQ
ncbi:MAG: hypothetical protein V7K21_23725 [Nostoc sp.]|uniref:hypothetical protein n=1 Tax=Nostoc sp. TaxID=1180 RepID=UPI002FFA8079